MPQPREAQLVSAVQVPEAQRRGEDVPGTGSGRNGGGSSWKWSGALEAVAEHGAQPKLCWPLVPGTPGRCWHGENWERGWPWQGSGCDFAGSVSCLGETGQVWKLVGVWRDALASSRLGLGGSRCYLLITEGLGMGKGEIKALPSAGTEQCGSVLIPLLHFTSLPSLKRNLGLAEPLPCTDFPFIFPIPHPRTAQGGVPGPGAQPCIGLSPNPFPVTSLNNRLVFLSVSDVARGIFFSPLSLLISKFQQPLLREPWGNSPGRPLLLSMSS